MTLVTPALKSLMTLLFKDTLFSKAKVLVPSFGSLFWPALTRKLLEKYDVGRQPSEEVGVADYGAALAREAMVRDKLKNLLIKSTR